MCLLTGRGVATMISQHDAEVKDASAPPCRNRAINDSLLRQISAARSDEPRWIKPTESSPGFRERRVSPGARLSPCRSTEARGRPRRSTRVATGRALDRPRVCTVFARRPRKPQRGRSHGRQRSSLFASWSNHMANSVNCVPDTRRSATRTTVAVVISLPQKIREAATTTPRRKPTTVIRMPSP